MKDFLPGDLAACYGQGLTSKVITYGTVSLLAPRRLRVGPSHVAIVCHYRGKPIWVESTSLCKHPCLIRKKRTSGVQAHRPEQRIRDYIEGGGRVDLYRLSPVDQLSSLESRLLTRILITHFVAQAVAYDTGGALLSGTRLFKHTRLLPRADLDELFCSELAAKVCMRLGRLNRNNPTKYNPSSLLRQLVREGTVQFERSYGPQPAEAQRTQGNRVQEGVPSEVLS